MIYDEAKKPRVYETIFSCKEFQELVPESKLVFDEMLDKDE